MSSPKLILCPSCQQHVVESKECPSCCNAHSFSKVSMAVLFGLGLIACGERDKDSASEPSSEPAEEPASEPSDALYGVASE